jgi:CheY-like chemotaxis protein
LFSNRRESWPGVQSKPKPELSPKAQPNPDLPRVLLVEDEQPIRDVVVPWPCRDGFDCREAADGRAATELLATETRISLALSNLPLPLVDGFTLLLNVKQHNPRIPFAFVATRNDSEVREEVMRDGGDAYSLKAFTEQRDTLAVLLPIDHFVGSEYGSS